MDNTFRTQWTITPHLPDESSALVDETHRRTHLTAHGKLGTAINYALNQKERMMNVIIAFNLYQPCGSFYQ